jgi:hypothetical protein
MSNRKKWILWGGSIAVTIIGGYLILFWAEHTSDEETKKIIAILNTIFLVGGFALSCFMLFRFHLLCGWSKVLQFILLLLILRVLYAQVVWWMFVSSPPIVGP